MLKKLLSENLLVFSEQSTDHPNITERVWNYLNDEKQKVSNQFLRLNVGTLEVRLLKRLDTVIKGKSSHSEWTPIDKTKPALRDHSLVKPPTTSPSLSLSSSPLSSLQSLACQVKSFHT